MGCEYDQALNIIDKETELASELNKTFTLLVNANASKEVIYMALHKTVDLVIYEGELEIL